MNILSNKCRSAIEASDLRSLKCSLEGSIILQVGVGVAIASGKKALKYDVEDPAPSISLPVACRSSGNEANHDQWHQLAENSSIDLCRTGTD
jgi:hypothetical protein